jgi:hypothetical protein
MEINEFVTYARSSLKDILNKSGCILYSAAFTFRPCDIFILGTNPGGDPDVTDQTISKHLEGLLTKRDNSYLDETWSNGQGKWPAGEAPLQKRMKWVLNALGYDLRDVCASNLVFIRSIGTKGINFYRDAEQCWDVNKQIINVVSPKLILAFGNSEISSYGFLRNKFCDGNEETINSGHGSWKCKGFYTDKLNKNKIFIAGLPHLSRYDPIGKNYIIDWLKNNLRK